MSLAAPQSLPARAAYTDEPIFRLTVEQYHELIRSGKLTEDDPVELLEGILVFKMPKKSPHATVLRLLRRLFPQLLAGDWFFDSEQPITLADGEPETDGAVLRGSVESYADHHPGPSDVALVIEVADSGLERDRGIKLRSYARAGIAVYWIINLNDKQIEVYTQPDSAALPAPTYRARKVVTPSESLSLLLPDHEPITIPAGALLPPAKD